LEPRAEGQRVIDTAGEMRIGRISQAFIGTDAVHDARGEPPAAEDVVHDDHREIIRIIAFDSGQEYGDAALVHILVDEVTPGSANSASVGIGGGFSPWNGQSLNSLSSLAIISARSKSPLAATTKSLG